MADAKWSDNTKFPIHGSFSGGDYVPGLSSGNNCKWPWSTIESGLSIDASQIVSGILPIVRGGTNNNAFYSNAGAQNGIIYYDSTRLSSGSNFTYDPTQGILQITSVSVNPGFSVYSNNSSSVVSFLSAARSSSSGVPSGSAQYRLLTDATNEWTWGTYNASRDLLFKSNNGANTVLTMSYSNNSVTINSGNLNVSNLTPKTVVLTDASDNLVSFSSGTSGQVLTSAGSGNSPIWTSVVNSLNGLTTNLNLTSTDGTISIIPSGTSIDLSTTGSGPTAAYGYVTRQKISSTDIHFTNITDYYIPKAGNVSADVNQCNNFSPYLDGNSHIGIQYLGTDTGVAQITFQVALAYSGSNTQSNNYQLSANLNLTAGPNGSFAPINILVSNNSGSNVPFTVYPSLITTATITFQIPISPNDVIYPNIRNDGPSINASLNGLFMTALTISAEKVGDVGGMSAGVASLNGLTGNIDLVSDGSVTITTPSSSQVQVSVGQYQNVSGTSQAMVANASYLCTNASLTSLSLPTTCAQGTFIKIAGSGSGLFTITQSSGQNISLGTSTTTTGATGHLDVQGGDSNSALMLVCTTANTSFMVVNSQGNFDLF